MQVMVLFTYLVNNTRYTQAKKKYVCLLSHVKKNLFFLLSAKLEIVVPGS